VRSSAQKAESGMEGRTDRMSLPKIALERQFEQLARIPIELKRRSETGC
jgi:hypothetical protein